jgi:mRNA degradation ribonuclease J1/J2
MNTMVRVWRGPDCGRLRRNISCCGIAGRRYLRENRRRLQAFLLTDSYEDHIDAVLYVLDEVDAPVYGMPFTLALVRAKLEEVL